MNKFKQSCLSLCLAFCVCVGFLLTDSIKVYAYEKEDNFYPIDSYTRFMFQNDGEFLYAEELNISSDGKYYLHNPQINDISYFFAYPYSVGENYDEWTFPYNADSYDYYLMGTVTAYCTDDTLSTFKPTLIRPHYYNMADDYTYPYDCSNQYIYDIDTNLFKGFGFYEKVDFQKAGNTGIRHITFMSDIHGKGDKPANLVIELGVMAVEKGTSEEQTLAQILSQLNKMESSINSSIGNAADSITDSIENQYEVEENEDFGVGDIQEQVEQKLGVLNFGADTLVGFLDLFSPSNAGNTVITFPGFSMKVQGQEYQVWNDIDFDLKSLENNFGILITAVRTMTVLSVWLAVLGYLVKAKDQLINNRG